VDWSDLERGLEWATYHGKWLEWTAALKCIVDWNMDWSGRWAVADRVKKWTIDRIEWTMEP